MDDRPGSKQSVNVVRVRDGKVDTHAFRDSVATEEPLEIRLKTPTGTHKLAVTMRTPGADFELAAGFLFGEGIIRGREDIASIRYCVNRDLNEEQRYNVVTVTLRLEPERDLRALERHFVVSSACGVCGKESLDALELRGLSRLTDSAQIDIGQISQFPAELRKAQQLFESTGGLHAAVLFDFDGTLIAVREDVGRHNAMDKLIGWALLENIIPLEGHAVLVSGRASFELVQKALAASIPVFCAISAPSSLAVDLARRFGLTLIGFLRGDSFNVYNGAERLTSSAVAIHKNT